MLKSTEFTAELTSQFLRPLLPQSPLFATHFGPMSCREQSNSVLTVITDTGGTDAHKQVQKAHTYIHAQIMFVCGYNYSCSRAMMSMYKNSNSYENVGYNQKCKFKQFLHTCPCTQEDTLKQKQNAYTVEHVSWQLTMLLGHREHSPSYVLRHLHASQQV